MHDLLFIYSLIFLVFSGSSLVYCLLLLCWYMANSNLVYDRAYSVTLDSWVSLSSLYNRIFERDFCHHNHLTFKITGTSLAGSNVRFRETFDFVDKQIQLHDDIRICLPIHDNSTIYARIRNNAFKLLYDHGIEVFRGLVYTHYASINMSKNLNNPNLQLGIMLLGRSYSCNNLLKLSGNYVKWFHKTTFQSGRFKMGLVGVSDFSTAKLLKKELLLGYCFDKFEVYADAYQNENEVLPGYFFSKYRLSMIYHEDSQRSFGIEGMISGNLRSLEDLAGVMEYKYNNKNRAKVRFTQKLALGLMWESRWNEHLTSSFGVHLPFIRQAKGEKPERSQLGLKVEVNL